MNLSNIYVGCEYLCLLVCCGVICLMHMDVLEQSIKWMWIYSWENLMRNVHFEANQSPVGDLVEIWGPFCQEKHLRSWSLCSFCCYLEETTGSVILLTSFPYDLLYFAEEIRILIFIVKIVHGALFHYLQYRNIIKHHYCWFIWCFLWEMVWNLRSENLFESFLSSLFLVRLINKFEYAEETFSDWLLSDSSRIITYTLTRLKRHRSWVQQWEMLVLLLSKSTPRSRRNPWKAHAVTLPSFTSADV